MDEIVFEPSDVNMLAALGIVESVKLFPFMLSMGELQYACDSEYRCKQFVNREFLFRLVNLPQTH